MSSFRASGRNHDLWSALDTLFGEDAITSAYLSSGSDAFDTVARPFVEKSKLLPNPEFTHKLSWVEVAARVPKAKKQSGVVEQQDQQKLYSTRNKDELDQLAQEVWPPRAKKDLSIRRTRFNDWFKILKQKDTTLLNKMLTHVLKKTFDYSLVTNLLCCACILGEEWINTWLRLGAFDDDIEHYTAVTKKVSDLGKTVGLADPNWSIYLENATACGYRNPPFPGFDPVVETEKLAHGGESHDLFGYKWDDLVEEFIHMDAKINPKFVPFSEFVTSAEWLTTGSSSQGKLEIETPTGKVKKVKARKNTVPDVVDLEELAQTCKSWNKQVNYAIIKSELGKIRMAVASDIEMYLQMTWINKLLNGAYNQWQGATTDEDFVRQTQRMLRMLKLTATKLGIPFDYASFDHQPTTEELVGIVRYLIKVARYNVPDAYMSEFELISSNIIEGFYNSTLEWRMKPDQRKFDVTGGLMSGLRFTSLIGNAWNSIMTGVALKLLEQLGVDTNTIERFIRGDDSAIYVDNWGTGAMLKACYDVVGIKAGEGKFSMQKHAMEFLRIWFEDRCYGYPLRALPGLTQRKPWSSAPWSPDLVLRAIYETVRILRRRLPDHTFHIDYCWRILKGDWCASHSLPREVVTTPVYLGGFGIETSTGPMTSIEPKISSLIKTIKPIKVLNQTSWRSQRIMKYYLDRYSEVLTKERCDQIAQDQLVTTVTSDDIPEVSKEARQQWNNILKRTRFKVTLIKTTVTDELPPTILDAFPLEQTQLLMDTLHARAPLFGSHPELATATTDYNLLRPKTSLRRWLKIYYPKAAHDLNQFHHSWYIGEAIDYLQGKLSPVPYKLHPSLTEIWHLYIASTFLPQHKLNRLNLFFQAMKYEHVITNSTLSRFLYQW
jgi:hypothetical protein